ncbi:exocyst complex component 2 [Aethina tumida]|uniref:exocyst complex component 2 n=1 Tax=Aethina tumida TaxID=116153 RepID=UPI00096B6449|nr:exocyst complex component 2 [Aethina tumida]
MAPPVVNGISPNEGFPGTRVVIRGENFGKKSTDLVGLTICGVNCLLSAEWVSENKIITLSGPIVGKGDVIVTTRMGGVGTSDVQFNGLQLTTVGPMKEVSVWVEETPIYTWERPNSCGTQDPLGLLVEESEPTISKKDFELHFPGKCGDFTSKDFSPAWFLLENYQLTSFEDLKAGLQFLQRRVKDQKNERLSFLKNNVSPIVNQIDTLIQLKQAYESDKFTDPTVKLKKAIQDSETKTKDLFKNVLDGWSKAEESRNALNILSRFKFLFYLPAAIEKNMKKGHYEIIINDYIRVKNLFGKTQIPIFKSALKEIESCIEKLQNKLYLDLQNYPINLAKQKQIIRYLVLLDSPQDAAWIAIKSRYVYINNEITTLFDQYYNISYEDNIATMSFVGDVCGHILDTFADLWNMGQSYFSGELNVKHKEEQVGEFKQMVKGIIENFCKSVEKILLNQENGISNIKTPEGNIVTYVPEILQNIRSVYLLFVRLSLPQECLDLLLNLLTNLKIHCIRVLFKFSIEKIMDINEDWSIKFSETYYGITNFPLQFCKVVQEISETIRMSIFSDQSENSVLQNQTAINSFNEEFETMLRTSETVLTGFLEDNEDTNDVSVNLPPLEKRCLLTLSNCLYLKNIVLNTLQNDVNYGFPTPTEAISNAKYGLLELEQLILNKYLELKSVPIINIIQESLYFETLNWDTTMKVTDIRPYIVNCINSFIQIHAEVTTISNDLLQTVLPQVAEFVSRELCKIIASIEKFNNFGALQTYTDICLLRKFLSGFPASKAEFYLEEALDNIISHLNEPITIDIENILKRCQGRMRLQFSCISCNISQQKDVYS